METFVSDISQTTFPISERINAKLIRSSIMEVIQADYPTFTVENSLSTSELNYYRQEYITRYLSKEIGVLTDLEKNVITAMAEHGTISDNSDAESVLPSTLGQRVADKVALFGGSWTFIISFGIFLLLWIFSNAILLSNTGFDPFPFIFLNLILSCLAAMQAPVIMMSQNRQEEKDRDRAKKDYMVNLKSELEIRMLHEKIDHLIIHQQQELLEIQKVQIDMMNDIMESIKQGK